MSEEDKAEELKKFLSDATIEEKEQLYTNLLHAMQSGVKYANEPNESEEVKPKHLRVGINAAMSDHAALVELLVDKGVFTKEEYLDKIIRYMKLEVNMYETELSQKYNKEIKLL